jgi:DNA-binding MarR family transcriptional regulator
MNGEKAADVGREEMVEKLMTTFHLFRYKVFHDFRPETGELALNRTQFRTLMAIHLETSPHMSRVCRQLDLEKGSLTAVVDSLIAHGLVARERDNKDRRKVNLALTGRGEALVLEHRRQAHRHLLAKMRSLSEQEKERFSEAFAVIHEITRKL